LIPQSSNLVRPADSLGSVGTQATIRPLTVADAAAIAGIYNHYVVQTTVTFEAEPVSAARMKERIEETIPSFPWLGLELEGELAGYAGASAWKSRCAYRYAVESTIYLRNDFTGKGWGTSLYRRLIDEVRRLGFHSMIGGVALPNSASERLHEKLGFKKIAHFEQVGWKFERWIDVAYWQLLL
jgi:L-amino acid N-acyltransferase YncA